MGKLQTFPPYGRMVAEFEERLGQGGAPDDWCSDVDWLVWYASGNGRLFVSAAA
jgi:hypothetical protein